MVECDVELVPAPAGSGRGASARRKINLSAIDNFDALHVTLADLVGAARPAGGRYDPSALQIAYVDANGAPAVLGAEPWATFASRAAFVQARLLAPGLSDAGASMSNSPKVASQPAAPSFHMPWTVPPAPAPAHNPFAAMLGMGAAPAPAADPCDDGHAHVHVRRRVRERRGGYRAGGYSLLRRGEGGGRAARDAAVTGGAVFFTKSSPGRAPSSERAHAPRTHVYHQYQSRRDVETWLRPSRGVGAETTRVVTHTYYLVAS
jgi:hypothetical protein